MRGETELEFEVEKDENFNDDEGEIHLRKALRNDFIQIAVNTFGSN